MARTEIFIAVDQLVVRTGAGEAGPGGVTEDSPGPAESPHSSATALGTLSGTPVTPLTVSLGTAGLVTPRHLVSVFNTYSVLLGFLDDLPGETCVPSTTLAADPLPQLTI